MDATPLVTARAIILHPNADAVLTREGELPEVTYAGHLYHGSAVTDLFAPFGPLTFLRRLAYRYLSAGDGEPVRVDAVFALASHSADLPKGGAWTKPENLTGKHRDDARVSLVPDPRVPWWSRDWFQSALSWADGVLLASGLERTDEPVLVKAWQASALYRLSTGEEAYYLKAVPACFAHEAALTRWLHTLQPGAAPRVLAVRDTSLFLMAGVRGRDFLEADTPAVLQVLAATQRQAETRTAELFNLGCPDRSPAVLARQVGALLAAARSFRDEVGGLTAAEVARLLDLEPTWLEMCQRLADSPVPLTLVHGDMHGGNVVTGRSGVTLLDWSDASVGFPFLDANVFYFLGPTTSPKQQAVARDSYLSVWTDALPKSQQQKAKSELQNIWMAATKQEAERAFDLFLGDYNDKYPEAAECLRKDRDALLTFYDFPARHGSHIRTTNSIESTATVRLRTTKTRNNLSRDTMLSLVFKLAQGAERKWLKPGLPQSRDLGKQKGQSTFV